MHFWGVFFIGPPCMLWLHDLLFATVSDTGGVYFWTVDGHYLVKVSEMCPIFLGFISGRTLFGKGSWYGSWWSAYRGWSSGQLKVGEVVKWFTFSFYKNNLIRKPRLKIIKSTTIRTLKNTSIRIHMVPGKIQGHRLSPIFTLFKT